MCEGCIPLSLCPRLDEIRASISLNFVLCLLVLKQCLTAGWNGETEHGFG